MPKTPPLDGFVLDAVSFDAEDLNAIVAFLNDPESEWRARFERTVQRPEVLASLMRLVRDGLLEVWIPSPDGGDLVACDEGVWPDRPIGELSFDLTGRGRVRYLNWDL
jgi:hypothetical protein